jgi:hypothetical protein
MKPAGAVILVGFVFFTLFSGKAFSQYKNLALNPNDVQDGTWTPTKGYPHATSNSEYPAPLSQPPNPQYYALNAIDGKTANTVETRDPSWGPNKIQGLWWRIAFGKTVQVDSVVTWIRADWSTTAPVPHDSYWKSATLVFSDSSKVTITIDSTAKSQAYKFSSRATNSLTITNLVPKADRWCALAEVQAWGYETPTAALQAATAHSAGSSGRLGTVCFLAGFSPQSVRIPPGATGAELYSLAGSKVWSCHGKSMGVSSVVPCNLAKGIYMVSYMFRLKTE